MSPKFRHRPKYGQKYGWPALLLGAALLSACSGTLPPLAKPAPVPPPVVSPPAASTPIPLPTPTLSLTGRVVLQGSEAVTVSATVNRLPDSLEVSGLPSGLEASTTSTSVTLLPSAVTPGTYTLTVTGVWGQQRVSAPLEVEVLAPVAQTPIAPVPPAAPAPVLPDFTLSLPQSTLNVQAGQQASLALNVGHSATLTDPVTFQISVSGADGATGLEASLTEQLLQVNATRASAGMYTVTVTGRAQGVTRTLTLPVTVMPAPAPQAAPTPPVPPAPPAPTPPAPTPPAPTPPTPTPTPTITNLTVSTSNSTLNAGESATLRAEVQGTGPFSRAVTWAVSGGAATLIPYADGSATLSVPSTAATARLTISATSVQDTTKTSTLYLDVKALAQTVTLQQTTLSLESGASGTIGYSGPVQMVTAQPSALIKSVTAQNGQLSLTAGSTGTGIVQLVFTMQDGGTQQVPLSLTVTAPPTSPLPVNPPPVSPPAPTSGYTWYPESARPANAQEEEVLRLTNQARLSGATCGSTVYPPAPPLTWNDQLARTARNHSLDMGKRAYFDHTTPEGVTFAQRITFAGFSWSTVAENIAAGYSTPQAVVDGWLRSAGHCVNLMNPNFTQLGVGAATVSGSPYGTYWTQSFGKAR